MNIVQKIYYYLICCGRFLTKDNSKFKELEEKKLVASLIKDNISVKAISPKIIEAKDFDSFDFASLKKNPEPLVIRGLAKDSEACKKWNIEFFTQRFSEEIVPINNMDAKGFVPDDNPNEMGNFKDIIENMSSNDKYKKYIGNFADIFVRHPSLEDDLPINRFKESFKSRHFGSQLFFGAKNTRTIWHCANQFNFFINVYGQKKWSLIHPKYSSLMRPEFSKEMIYCMNHIPYALGVEEADRLYPGYAQIPKREVVLEPGDVLLNPSWWWHAVDNISDFSIGVATRFQGPIFIHNQNKLFSFFQLLSPHQWYTFYKLNKGHRLSDDFVKSKYDK